jgi:transcriptional regulator with XRE-family HTH domain
MTVILTDMAALGRAIAAARTLAGLDQADLASASGVAASTVSNVERGCGARDDTLRSIRRALRRGGVSLLVDKTNGIASVVLRYDDEDDSDD